MGKTMRRREFIALAGAVAAWPLAGHAQQTAIPVIGALNVTAGWPPDLGAAFRRGLAQEAYVEGKNLTIEYRDTNFRPELLREAAREMVQRNVNVILAVNPEALAAASAATTSIPIVGIDLESDPLAKGYVKSLARPGGNLTGMFLDLPELSGKQVGLLKEIVPRLSRLAIFGVPGLNAAQFTAAGTAVRSLAADEESNCNHEQANE